MQKFKTSIQIKKANKYHTYGAQQDPLVAYRVLACLVLEELWQQVDYAVGTSLPYAPCHHLGCNHSPRVILIPLILNDRVVYDHYICHYIAKGVLVPKSSKTAHHIKSNLQNPKCFVK